DGAPPETAGPALEVPATTAPEAGPAAAAVVAGVPVTAQAPDSVGPPRTGVEIVDTEERDGTRYHTMRDLRNGSVVKNVTRASARKLWHYAISAKESGELKPETVTWRGDLGLWRKTRKGGAIRYDLVQRTDEGLRVYYGVTEDGIHGPWKRLVDEEEKKTKPALGAPSAEAEPIVAQAEAKVALPEVVEPMAFEAAPHLTDEATTNVAGPDVPEAASELLGLPSPEDAVDAVLRRAAPSEVSAEGKAAKAKPQRGRASSKAKIPGAKPKPPARRMRTTRAKPKISKPK
ncbi:MAG: hypothetical protein ACRDH2_05585, partial [Anaerolineales bacterium]